MRAGQTLERIARQHDVSVDEAPADWGAPEQPGRVELRRPGEEPIVSHLRVERGVSRAGLRHLEAMMRRNERDADRHTTPRLALLLARLSDHFGGRAITVVSGFREPRRFSGTDSQHVAGIASDIQIADVPNRTLWEYCRTIDAVGCGLYPRSNFVHVDAREERTHWVDWSRPAAAAVRHAAGPARRGQHPVLPMDEPTETLPLEVPVVEDDPHYVAPMPPAPASN
ncbi:MAG: DUF882 domain-containing protein [Sandaracinaceae bacterium]|nr:DUF882 domain-containing protein [Sandaracinaceae bacterium]